MLDVNLGGVMTAARVGIPALLRRPEPRDGRFIAVASAAAVKGLPMLAAYCASKAGVTGFIRALAVELAAPGITANAVSPGSTRTRDPRRVRAALRLDHGGLRRPAAARPPARARRGRRADRLAGEPAGARRDRRRPSARRRPRRFEARPRRVRPPLRRRARARRPRPHHPPHRQGPAALRALLADTATPAQRRLGDRLVRAGMAHPRPRPQHRPTTIVIPVRDHPCRRLQGRPRTASIVVDDGSRTPVPARSGARRPAGRRRRATKGSSTWTRNSWPSWTATPTRRRTGSSGSPGTSRTRRSRRSRHASGQAARHGRAPGRGQARAPGPVRPDARCSCGAARSGRPLRSGAALRRGRGPDLAADRRGLARPVRPERGRRHEDHHVLKRRFLYGTSAAPLKQRHPDKLKHVIVRPWPVATLALLAARGRGSPPRRSRCRPRSWPGCCARAACRCGSRPSGRRRPSLPTVTQFAKLAGPYGAGVLYGRISLRYVDFQLSQVRASHERTASESSARRRRRRAHHPFRRADQGALRP